MSRFKDTPGLFGNGIGTSTSAAVTCEVCGTEYNVGINDDSPREGYDVFVDEFAGLTVCDCCFERLEEAVWQNRRLILGFYLRRIESYQASLQTDKTSLEAVLDAGAQNQRPAPATTGLRIRNKGSGESYDLSTDPAGRPIAIRQYTITNPQEWEILPG